MIRAWCFRDPGTAPVDVERDSLHEHLGDETCLLWIDADDPTPQDIEFLSKELGIHELTAEDLVNADQRTKLERLGDHHHVALHVLAFVDDELQSREVDVVFSEGWLLSVRHDGHEELTGPVKEAKRRFEQHRAESGSNDEGFLLWAILDVIVDQYFVVTDAFDDHLDAIEDVVFGASPAPTPQAIFDLRRAIVAFRRVVGPLHEVLNQLLHREAPCIGDAALTHLRDVHDHTLRVLGLVESQRELLTGLLEGQLAIQSNQINTVMKATSSWGAILIASTLIAGIYGMNFEHMPELDWYLGYPFALGLMGLVTIILYRVFKSRGWL